MTLTRISSHAIANTFTRPAASGILDYIGIFLGKFVAVFTAAFPVIRCYRSVSHNHILAMAYGFKMRRIDAGGIKTKVVGLKFLFENLFMKQFIGKSVRWYGSFPLIGLNIKPSISITASANPHPAWTEIGASYRNGSVFVNEFPESNFRINRAIFSPAFSRADWTRRAVMRMEFATALFANGDGF
jgi:hypothetical protein